MNPYSTSDVLATLDIAANREGADHHVAQMAKLAAETIRRLESSIPARAGIVMMGTVHATRFQGVMAGTGLHFEAGLSDAPDAYASAWAKLEMSGMGLPLDSLGRRVRVTVEILDERDPEWKLS